MANSMNFLLPGCFERIRAAIQKTLPFDDYYYFLINCYYFLIIKILIFVNPCMLYDVFISHSSKDVEEVSKIVEFLEQEGFVCFVSYRDIPHCEDWADYLIEALEQSRSVVYVHTPAANNSNQIIREIQISVDDMKKPFVTYRLTDEPFKGGKKYFLQTLNWIDSIGDSTRALPLLAKTLKTTIERSESVEDNELLQGSNVSIRQRRYRKSQIVTIVVSVIAICILVGISFLVSEQKKEQFEKDNLVYTTLLQHAESDMADLKDPETAFNRLDSAAVIATKYRKSKYNDRFSADISKFKIEYTSILSENLIPLTEQIVQWYGIYDLIPSDEVRFNILSSIEKVQYINSLLGQKDSTAILDIKKALQK